ncbi:MAG: hypothetical protein ACOY3L_10630 [Pseudomonadota bacterium]
MAAESLVTMDGPGPFVFGRLQGPIEVQRAPNGTAIAIRGQMQVNETGRRVIVRIPLAIEDARTLLELLRGCLQPGAPTRAKAKASRGKINP